MKKTYKRMFTLLMAFALIFEFGFSTSIMTAYAESGESSYPAVTLSETVDGVKVTLEAPEGAFPAGTTMSVNRVDRQDVFDAVGKEFEEDGRTMSDAVAFDVTPHDISGNEVQPRKKVKLSFSGTELDADDSGINVYRVSDDAKEVTEMDTSVATADEQQFATDHFTIYVEGGSADDPHGDGSGSNHRNHNYFLEYGQQIQLHSTYSSSFSETWYLDENNSYRDALTIVDEDNGIVKNTNPYAQDVLVEVRHKAGLIFEDFDLPFWFNLQRKKVHINVYFKDAGDDDFKLYGTEERWIGDAAKLKVPSDYPQYKVVDGKIYVLEGWYTDKECTLKPMEKTSYWTKDSYPYFLRDTNIYGRYKLTNAKYAIVYASNTEDCTDVPQCSMPKEDGSSIVEVRNDCANRPGYVNRAGNWSTDPNATEPDPNYTAYKQIDVAKDPHAKNGVLVLYPTWDVYADISYEFDWDHYGWGSVDSSFDWIRDINQEAKGATAIPKKGYRFKEWRDSAGCVVSTEPKFVPKRNESGVYVKNIYTAYFEPITYKVSFVSNSTTEVASQTVGFEGKATKPEDPASDSCAASAVWYTDKACKKPFDFDTVIDRDMTLYAKWDTVHKEALTEVAGIKATCEAPGNIHYWTCKDCGRCYSDAEGKNEISKDSTVIAQLPHVPGNTEIDDHNYPLIMPTCTAEGQHFEVIYCTKCFKLIYSNMVIDDPLGHDWEVKEPEEGSEDGKITRVCKRCGATETIDVEGEHPHEIEKVDQVEPTCEAQGKKEHYRCKLCGALFRDEAGTEPIEDEGSLGIPAKGHKTKTVTVGESVAATCTTEGRIIQLKQCKACGALIGTPEIITLEALGHDWDAKEKEVTKEATCTENGSYDTKATCKRCGLEMVYHAVDYAKGHSLEKHDAVDGCEDKGHIEYWSCSECGKLFSDAEGSAEISEKDTLTEPVGHTPGEPVQENRKNATYTSEGSVDNVVRCTRCNKEISRSTEVIPKLEKDEYNIDIKTSVDGDSSKSGGTVIGSRKGKKGKGQKLTAKPSSGYNFLYWLIGGERYDDKEYNLLVNDTDATNDSITVEAVFGKLELPYAGGLFLRVGETYNLGEELYSGSPQAITWESSDTKVAKVDNNGVITAVAAGISNITGNNPDGSLAVTYTVNVDPKKPVDTSVGTSHKVNGSTYKILSKSTVSLTKAKNVKTVTVPATVKIGGKTFKVTKIGAKAFSKSKATKMIVKTKKLTKKSVKRSLKGSKIKTVKVSLGKKALNKKYVKKYKAYFTYKNAGKKVAVK